MFKFIVNLFKKQYCDICGKRIKGKPNKIEIAEDSKGIFFGKICDECANIIDKARL